MLKIPDLKWAVQKADSCFVIFLVILTAQQLSETMLLTPMSQKWHSCYKNQEALLRILKSERL